MSKRGVDFLELWMERHLAGAGDAAGLARRGAAYALAGGISREEIEEEAGPLVAFIAAAVTHPANDGDVVLESDD